ncbi:MAG: hypothetical protein ACM3ML_12645 [Micromonosporaceae bacterium]
MVPRQRGALPDEAGHAYPAASSNFVDRDSVPERASDATSGRQAHDKTETADRAHVIVDRPDFQDHFGKLNPPDCYGDPLTLPDGTRMPLLNGRPERSQAEQGVLGDCGIIATLGAVAAHRPDDIADRVSTDADGSYLVQLHDAEWTPEGICAPTDKMIELIITPNLPIYNKRPDIPAFASADRAAWTPVLEKAIAGTDQAWTPQQTADWAATWDAICAEDANRGVKNPRSGPPPTGYVRLNQGSTPWERAELLTQLTGQQAGVLLCPDRPADLNEILARQLRENKPILVSARPEKEKGEELPHNLEASHVYEVVDIVEDKIVMRNPWNRQQPEPMSPEQFVANMRHTYATLI